MTQGKCDICGKPNELTPMYYSDGEKLMLCSECYCREESRGDYEYERWKEEQPPKPETERNPDKERDQKKEDQNV